MDPITLAALAEFPDRLEANFTPQQLARAAEFEGHSV
jgi:hypothetical protein